MGSDYRGYAPDHYSPAAKMIADYKSTTTDLDEVFITSIHRPLAVHVFNGKVVIVGNDGRVYEVSRNINGV